MATDAQVITATQFGWKWLVAHERLVMLALVLAVGTFGISKFFDVEAARKDAKYVAAEQIVANDQKNSAALASQTAQVTQQYQALVQALSAQNASLAASVASRNVVLTQQVTKNSTLPLPELLARWNMLAGTTVAVNGDNAIVSVQDSRKTVDLLESVPVLMANLADQTKIAQNYQNELQKADLLVNEESAQITGLNKQLTDQATANKTEVAAVKAEGKKNSVKWFKRGFLVGFISGIFVGHAAGI